jgi:hypothetical protein
LLFAGCLEISAMETASTSAESYEYNKETMEELNTILEIEKNFPGFFAKIIVDSLRAVFDGVHPVYFGIQASSTRSYGGNSLYLRSLNLDFQNFNQSYERENSEQQGNLKRKQSERLFKAKEPRLDDLSHISALSSDRTKIGFLDGISEVSLDTNNP